MKKNIIIILLLIALIAMSAFCIWLINNSENKNIIQSADLNKDINNEEDLMQKQNLNEINSNITSDLENNEESSENTDLLYNININNYNKSNIDKDKNVYFKRADSNIIIKYFKSGENSGNIIVYDNNKEIFKERLNKEVKDIESVDYYYGNDIYILFEDGSMGKVAITLGEDDILKYNYEQLNDKKNIDKLYVINQEYETAGANIILYAIDKNGKIIFLDAAAV